jgi:filamentous hemagglutinin family protein
MTTVCQAQITPDGTLPTEITTPDNLEFIITGGSRAGGNLFHSFSEFSLPTGGSATFDNATDIQNIISRVTGGSPSNIDGLIKAGGSANLFLINPNGIIFSANAKLEIGGSFLTSTAGSIIFADGKSFVATAPATTPLLTVSAPIGLQYGQNAANTGDRSILINGNAESPGLQVQEGKTLALVGEDIFVRGGVLIAPEGRIELGSVSDNSFVSLTPVDTNSIDKGWILGYDTVQNFRDIQLSDGAFVASHIPFGSGSSGAIQLQGRQLTITGGANVRGENSGDKPGGNITIQASESTQISGKNSTIANNTYSDAKGGDIAIETRQLFVNEGGTIEASSIEGTGDGGNLTIVAPGSVEIAGFSGNGSSKLVTRTFSAGNAGTLQITTGTLILNQGGQISTSTIRSSGNGGNLFIDATKSVEVSGQSVNGESNSALFAQSFGKNTTGNGGNLQINTPVLIVQDGGVVSVSSVRQSRGAGGKLSIIAPQSIEVVGTSTNAAGQVQPSILASKTKGSGNAGNVTIQTNRLNVINGAEITVSSEALGNTGNLEIDAGTISLDNEGKLLATSKEGRGGGNITLQDVNSLFLRGGSVISTNSAGEGNGGNIAINTNILLALGNSDITAKAVEGRGGNIKINTQGLFSSTDSDITATSDKGIDGVVEINRSESDPNDDMVSVPMEPVDLTELIATGCGASGSIASKTSTSKFIITGRGGLPPTPTEALRSDRPLVDLGTSISPNIKAETITATEENISAPTAIEEAQGWVISPQGQIILTASAPNANPEVPWLKSPSCHNS